MRGPGTPRILSPLSLDRASASGELIVAADEVGQKLSPLGPKGLCYLVSSARSEELALGVLQIKHGRVDTSRPVIVLTPSGYQCDMFISSEHSSRMIEQAEILVRDLKYYRARLAEWSEQIDMFQGSELPADLRRLGFKDQR